MNAIPTPVLEAWARYERAEDAAWMDFQEVIESTHSPEQQDAAYKVLLRKIAAAEAEYRKATEPHIPKEPRR